MTSEKCKRNSAALTLVCGEARVLQILNPVPAPRDNAADSCRPDCLSPTRFLSLVCGGLYRKRILCSLVGHVSQPNKKRLPLQRADERSSLKFPAFMARKKTGLHSNSPDLSFTVRISELRKILRLESHDLEGHFGVFRLLSTPLG